MFAIERDECMFISDHGYREHWGACQGSDCRREKTSSRSNRRREAHWIVGNWKLLEVDNGLFIMIIIS